MFTTKGKFDMKSKIKPILGVLTLGFLGINLACAGPTIEFGENNESSLTVGMGLRTSYTNADAGTSAARTNDFSLDTARVYLSGKLNSNISGMLNYDAKAPTPNGGTGEVIDANAQFAISPDITIWAGRFLSPSDRANMAGSFYSLGGGYWSSIASRYGYNGGYIGRDDGVAVVGSAMLGKLQYGFGAFNGHTAFNIAPAPAGYTSTAKSSQPMYSGRVQYDFWDAEPGLLYGTGNYLGGKDILAIGIATRMSASGSSYSTYKGDYNSTSVDFLFEKKGVGPGALSLEAAYYTYNTDGVVLSEQGKAYSGALGYIFKEKIGWGQFQPFVRYQKFNADTQITTEKYDFGTDYIIKAYNARVAGFYSKQSVTNSTDTNSINVALQVQF